MTLLVKATLHGTYSPAIANVTVFSDYLLSPYVQAIS